MRVLRYVAIATIINLAACSNGAHGQESRLPSSANVLPAVASTPPMPVQPTTHQSSPTASAPVPVTVTYVLPGGTKTQRYAARALQAFRRTQYISTSNTSITVTVTPLGGSPTTYGPTSCTPASCTVSFTATPGPTTLAFTLTDGSSNVLSRYSTVTIIQPTTINTLGFTASPVVSSVALSLTSASVNAGAPINDLITLNASDADGNTIVGNSSYVDVNGDPVTFMLNVTNAQAGGRGTVSIQGPTRITAPGQAAISAHYDGNWLQSATISVTSTSSAVNVTGSATLTTTPTAYENIKTGLSNPYAIIAGPDGALWFTEDNASRVNRLTVGGAYSSVALGGPALALTVGADGNIWIGQSPSTTVSRLTLQGALTNFSLSSNVGSIISGPDGQIWLTSDGYTQIQKVSLNGQATTYSSGLSGGNQRGIAQGPDGNIWFVQENSGYVGRITPTGKITEYGPTSCNIGFGGWGMAAGPDGNLWFSERACSTIGRVTPGGIITEYSAGMGSAQPVCIVAGPDGNMWFGTDTGDAIGRITTGGNITLFTTGITSGASPQCLTFGPDGNIWFTEWSGGKVGKFIL